MKRIIILFLLVSFLVIPFSVFADRDNSTIKAYTSNTLVKRGDWKIYRITYVASSNSGSFTVYDSLDGSTANTTTVKTEGSEATSGNGKTLDFTNKPLEGSTGLYLFINNATVIVEYE